LVARPGLGCDKELRIQLAAEVVTEHLERARAVTEGAGYLPRRALFDEVRSQSLVLAVLGRGGLKKEAATVD